MKWMIASDIHGSATYCRMMLDRYAVEKADRLILLGDLLYHGPRNDLPDGYAPKEVIRLLNDYRSDIICVRGNCEAEVDQMVLDFPVMAEYAVLSAGKNIIYLTHGHHANEQDPPPLKKGDILLCGHTHIPACVEHDQYVYINPGSVSIPKNGSRRSYLIFDGERFIWKDLEDGKIYQEYDLKIYR